MKKLIGVVLVFGIGIMGCSNSNEQAINKGDLLLHGLKGSIHKIIKKEIRLAKKTNIEFNLARNTKMKIKNFIASTNPDIVNDLDPTVAIERETNMAIKEVNDIDLLAVERGNEMKIKVDDNINLEEDFEFADLPVYGKVDKTTNFDSLRILIMNGSVGYIKLGMPVSTLHSYYDNDEIKYVYKKNESKNDQYYILINNYNMRSLKVTTNCNNGCKVGEVTIYDPNYKTLQGIGVGSTIKDLKKQYRNLKIFTSELGVIVYTKEMDKVAFILENFSLNWRPDGKYFVEDIPEDIKIGGVQLRKG